MEQPNVPAKVNATTPTADVPKKPAAQSGAIFMADFRVRINTEENAISHVQMQFAATPKNN